MIDVLRWELANVCGLDAAAFMGHLAQHGCDPMDIAKSTINGQLCIQVFAELCHRVIHAICIAFDFKPGFAVVAVDVSNATDFWFLTLLS